MDKEEILSGITLFTLVVGVPLTLLFAAVHFSQPKERAHTQKDDYPDDHFFI
jgi:hypothetical protein